MHGRLGTQLRFAQVQQLGLHIDRVDLARRAHARCDAARTWDFLDNRFRQKPLGYSCSTAPWPLLEIKRWNLVLKLLRIAPLAVCLVIAAAHSAHALDERRASPGSAGAGIENCVSNDWIQFGSRDQSMVLSDADHRLVRAEMLRRYRVLENDGFPSSRTILWQKTGGALVYIAVLDHPAKPGRACFSATFAAEKLDATLLLRRKYLELPAPDAATR